VLDRVRGICEVWLVRGDQCAHGQKDTETGRPLKKSTGWMTNSQVIANELARRCRCTVPHQHVIGANRYGSRSGQVAAYPVELARAI